MVVNNQMQGMFKDKVVIITGAAQGIGRCLASNFSSRGAKVGLIDLNEEGLKEVSKEIKTFKNNVSYEVVDVSSSEQVNASINRIAETFNGRVDIMLNNAGLLRRCSVEESTDDHWNLMIGVNLMGAVYCSRAVIPYMKKNNAGAIVNVSSILGRFPNTYSAAYGVAKQGISLLTKVMAAELAPYNIRVNAYAPGVADTPMASDIVKNRPEPKLQQIALKRFAKPQDIANLAMFLSSENAGYITGETIAIDGGMWITQRPTATW